MTRYMKSLVKEDVNKDGLSYRTDYKSPSVGFDEVKIKVLATAVCGTDKSIYNSGKSEGIRKEMQRYLPAGQTFKPMVIGHEFCGIVEEVGPGVTSQQWKDLPEHLLLQPGDYVTAEMHLACGRCFQCRTGSQHICTSFKVKGLHLDGCFAESVVLPNNNVILLGKQGDTAKIPPHIGALLDAFGNAVHTVEEADVRGKSVAILGAGPLGLMAVFLCKAFGATRIYLTEATDIDRRFTLGKEFGADLCVDVASGSKGLYQEVEKFEKQANGVDVVLEMSGAPTAYQDAFSIVRNGGKVVLLGIPRQPLQNFDIANSVIWKGVTVKGIFGRKMFSTWETLLRLLNSDQFDMRNQLRKVVAVKQFALSEFEEAFAALTCGSEMKLVFDPSLDSSIDAPTNNIGNFVPQANTLGNLAFRP